MDNKHLTSTEEIIRELGGPAKVARIVGVSPQAVCNWNALGKLQPYSYVALTEALKEKGLTAPASLWRMREPAS
jgi:hypothetical protein